MSNIEQIKNVIDLENKLSESELVQYNKFKNKVRRLQYLLSHAIVKDVCGENIVVDKNGVPTIKSGFVSIAHKDNLVVVAISNMPVGIDIENTSVNRDFVGESELLNLPKPIDNHDFYKNFVQYESKFKFGKGCDNTQMNFYDFDNYLVGVCSNDPDIEFISFCAE